MFLDRMPPRTFVWLHQNPPECANKSLRIVPSTPHHVLHALALETCRALSYLQSYLRNYKSTSPPSSSKSGWAVEIELEIEGVTDIPTVTRRLLDGYSTVTQDRATFFEVAAFGCTSTNFDDQNRSEKRWVRKIRFRWVQLYIRWIYNPKNSIFPIWDPTFVSIQLVGVGALHGLIRQGGNVYMCNVCNVPNFSNIHKVGSL